MRLRARSPLAALRLAAFAAAAAALFGAGSAAHAGGPLHGIAAQPPTAIVSAARAAIDGVATVHIEGSGVQGTTPVMLDLSLVAGRGGEGTVALGDLRFQFVVIGGESYFEASAGFWRRYANAAVGQLFANRWLKVPTTGQFASLAMFGNMHAVFASLLTPGGTLVKGPVTTVRGEQVVAVTNPAKGGTLYVAARGTPYPVEIVDAHETRAAIVIDRIDAPVSLVAPAGAIDLAALATG